MDAEAQPGGLWWNRVREEERRREWGRRGSKHTDEQGCVATEGLRMPSKDAGGHGGILSRRDAGSDLGSQRIPSHAMVS